MTVTTTPTLHLSDLVAAPRYLATRVLMGIAALAAAASAVGAIGAVRDADAAIKMIETWRGYGYLVFAGLFALLALRPRQYRGVWELVIFNKIALTVTAILFGSAVVDTGTVIVWDGGLSVLLLVAYVGCRGWRPPELGNNQGPISSPTTANSTRP